MSFLHLQANPMSASVVPILQMRKSRLRGTKKLIHSHNAKVESHWLLIQRFSHTRWPLWVVGKEGETICTAGVRSLDSLKKVR